MELGATYNLSCRRGDVFDLTVTYKAAGQPVDLTGYTAEMAIAWPHIHPRQGPGRIVLTGAITPLTGAIAFHISDDQTAVIQAAADAQYQIRLKSPTYPNGEKRTLLTGDFNFLPMQFKAPL